MLFYTIDVELSEAMPTLERREKAEQANALQFKIESHFTKLEHETHITISNIFEKKQKAVLCAAVKKGTLLESGVTEFLNHVELGFSKYDIQETTMESYFNLLRTASRNDYISDDDDVIDKLSISDFNSWRRRNRYSEALLKQAPGRQELLKLSNSLLCDVSLSAELGRIFQGASMKTAGGHPVHYILQSDSRESRNKMLKTLLGALHMSGRITSRRYCEVSYCGNDSIEEDELDALYEMSAGATVVVSFAEEESNDSMHARVGADVIEGLCVAMRKARNKVLTVFCISKTSRMVKEVFLEHLGAVTVVPISEEAAFGDKARGYLRSLAREQGVRADKSLYKPIKDGTGYSAANLSLIFDEWFDRRLKTKVYAQYADIEAANKQISSSKPKGTAIEELTEMIGLREVKSVVQQALDYYKAQKLFREKGITADRPAMHMVFSGNPGTAKTTVARLFAQIMKDNGLLSVGDLYEVGRADLVGKYVGWTAPTVKKKFRAAKGSVLFIDEAYSLVDDREGLYGDEAINTIVQEMENCREDMVVIFAGYPDKMEGFLQKNPGLRSRIAFHVPFADYDAEELCLITELLAANKKMRLGDCVRGKLMPLYESALKSEDFGNGRFARNMLEKAIMKQATRLVSMDLDSVTKNDIELLLADDFEMPAVKAKSVSRIGFGV